MVSYFNRLDVAEDDGVLLDSNLEDVDVTAICDFDYYGEADSN